MIASEGYLYVPQCIEDKALQALRAEADSLFNLKRSKCALSEDEYFDKGCTLDFFTNNDLHENDEARVSMERYMSRRNGPRRPRGTSTPASAGAREQQPCTAPSHASRGDRNSPDKREENWTNDHVTVVREIVFETLAGLARDALKAQQLAQQLGSPNLHQPRQPNSDDSAESVHPTRTGPKPSPTALQGGRAAEESARQGFSPSTNAGNSPCDGAVPRVAALTGAKRNAGSGCGGGVGGGVGAGAGAVSTAGADAGGGGTGRGGAGGGSDDASAASAGAGAELAAGTGFCGNEAAAAGREGPLLFNEQYVVKPPRSSIEFGWHTDEREQLAMCVFPPGVAPPVYVSVWLALDDCDAVNGCLEVYPQAWNRPRLQAPSDDDDIGVVCIPAKTGDAVVFLSNLWHRSGPNQTERARRVFYAQYSVDVIRATPSDPRPLSLAVPCPLSGTAGVKQSGDFSRPEPPSLKNGAFSVAAAAAVGAERRFGTVERNPDDSVDSAAVGLVRKKAEAERDSKWAACRGNKRGRWEGSQDAADEEG